MTPAEEAEAELLQSAVIHLPALGGVAETEPHLTLAEVLLPTLVEVGVLETQVHL